MSLYEIVLIGIGLGMDAFSVSICKGLAMKDMSWKKAIVVGLYFGTFQALMPILGFCIGIKFQKIIEGIGNWIAFAILSIIGINMIRETNKAEVETINDSINIKTMLILALATSIDALAVGATFAILKYNIINATITIGIITFIMSLFGVKIGNVLGERLKDSAEKLGGAILISIGVKLLIA